MKTPGFHVCVLLLFLLFAFPLAAQQYVVTGYVINSQDAPVGKALIQLENTSTTTNSKGQFSLRTDVLPSVLTVKHHHYNTREFFVNLPPVGEDTVFVTVHVEDKSTELEEVTVTASRVIWAYPKRNVHIIDFELYDEGMLLLCKDDKEYLIRLVNELSEPLFDLPIRRHPKSLLRDCTGALHILYPDSAYQIAVINDSILQPCGVRTTDYVRRSIQPCALAIRSSQVYSYEGNSRQSVDYVMIDTLSHKVTRLYLARNRKYQRQLEEYQLEQAREMRTLIHPAAEQTLDDQLLLQDALEKRELYERLLLRPAYVPAFRLRDSIVIFDHLNDTAIVFNRQGRQVRTYPIIYQHHRKWDHELIMNEEGTRIFARYDYRGMAHLLEISPNTGEVLREVALEKHIYPYKIQVRGNFIYYIFHHYIDYSINYVYKQRIE